MHDGNANMITQQEVDTLLTEPQTQPIETMESLKEQNAVLLNVIKDYQHMLYHQSNYIAQLVNEGQPMEERTIH